MTHLSPDGEPSQFNAGTEPVAAEDGRPFPSWPPAGVRLGVRRSPPWWFLDRSADDPPIGWEALVSVYEEEDEPPGDFPD